MLGATKLNRFEINGNVVSFTSDATGSHVALFGPNGASLKYRPDASLFQPDHGLYKWAFEYLGQYAEEQRFVFATFDRVVVGRKRGSSISVTIEDVGIVRDSDGRPIRLEKVIPPVTTLSPLESLAAYSSVEVRTLARPRVLAVVAPSPKVSIITCSYNRPKMLLECIASVRKQTDDDWEHLIVDSGSTDDAVKATLERAAALDPRVRVWRKSPNVNQPARFWNELLDRVRGKYIAFLDDDNLKHPEFVEVLSAVLDEAPEVDMVTCGWVVIDKSEGVTECHLNLKTTSQEVERRSTIDTGAFLIRREAFEKIGYFPLNIRTNEDWALMRRAVECLEMVHLPDALATYRSHDGQRMEYCEKLGNERDKKVVQGSVWALTYGVRVFSAPEERLTMSQKDVVEGAKAGLEAIPWVEEGSDLAIVLMPFQMDVGDLEMIAANHRTVVSVHSEDPFALNVNLEKVRAMVALCDDLWVCSNDTTCLGEYRALVGDRVIVCSSLSIDHRAMVDDAFQEPPLVRHPVYVKKPMGDRPHDVLLVGYAYPGRVKFVEELCRHLDRKRLTIVGDGWKEAGFEALPTSAFLGTAHLYAQAKAVICVHRGHGDCVDGPYEPSLVQRGYVEGMGGARVFADSSRPDHAFDDGEVEWFDTAHDLFVKLDRFLQLPAEKQEAFAAPLRQRCWRDFTYRTRMARIINAVRSPRYGAVIP